MVDPPYGIGESGAKNHTRSKLAISQDYHPFAGKDAKPPGIEYFKELRRVSKNQIIFGANHFISKIPAPQDAPCWIAWDKMNGENDFADIELAYTSFHRAAKIFRFCWAGMRQGNMREKEIRIHPTQKPVALYAWIFSQFAEPGQKVLDTHLGSGSSRIAAWDAGLDFTGYEIDAEYFKAQQKRFEEHAAQINIFTADGGE